MIHLTYIEAYVQEGSGTLSIGQTSVLPGSQGVAACVGQLNGQLWLHKENGLVYLVHGLYSVSRHQCMKQPVRSVVGLDNDTSSQGL